MLSFLFIVLILFLIEGVAIYGIGIFVVVYMFFYGLIYIVSKRYILNMVTEEEAKSLKQQVMQSREYRAQLRRILDELDLGIIVVDDDLVISYMNTTARDLFQIKSDVRHQHIKETDIPKSVISYITDFYHAHVMQREYTRKERTYDVRLSEITLYENRKSLMMIFDDVTLEKSTEQMKKDFFSYASHELKSPLTSIRGYAELIEHQMLPQKQYSEAANKIVNQTNVMSRLVEDMLMLSRLENYQESKQINVDVDEKLKEVLETLKPTSNEKNIVIDVEMHKIKFLCDPLDIIKLLKNPIENAIKYSPEDSSIFIKLEQSNGMMHFSVKDQGYGISKKDQLRVFERFYRVEKDRIQEGTGLGLAIVKHIVLKYNGVYELQSEPDQGTTLQTKIPLKEIK